MVNLLTGPKGSGKTQQMIELANETVKQCDGNVTFIKNSHNDTYSLSFDIRVICMDDYPFHPRTLTTTLDLFMECLSANHDIQAIFIDGILKHANISSENMPRFIERLKNISKRHDVNFYLSISAEKDQLNGIDLTDCALLN